MRRQIVSTDNAPKAIGPYSQAVTVEAARLVFCSGQISIDPATGNLVEGDIRKQAEQVLRNLNAVLEAAGSSLERSIKITVYLKNMEDYAAFNSVYAAFFKSDPPARAVVGAAQLPKDALVEIDAIAAI
jgi:2-iminobutanoate/2-iminopropanoate deaminase